MQAKKIGDITVNDGGGLYDSAGMIESLIIDCNSIVKSIFSGEYIGFCAKAVEMVQKLAVLKQGVNSNIESLQKQIDELTAERSGENV